MSTQLKTLKGSIEIPKNDDTMTSDYKETDVQLNSFYGGKERGKSLQVTFLSERGYSHVQLDNKNVNILFNEIKEHFNL